MESCTWPLTAWFLYLNQSFFFHMHVCVWVRGGGGRERERLQLSTCQPFALLSCQPPPAGARYPMVQNREGLGKPLFPPLRSPPSSSGLCPSLLGWKCQTDCHWTAVWYTVSAFTHQITRPSRAAHWFLFNIRAPYVGIHSDGFSKKVLDMWSLCSAVIVRV